MGETAGYDGDQTDTQTNRQTHGVHSPAVTCGPTSLGVDMARLSARRTLDEKVAFLGVGNTQLCGTFFLADNQLAGDTPVSDRNPVTHACLGGILWREALYKMVRLPPACILSTGTGLGRQNSLSILLPLLLPFGQPWAEGFALNESALFFWC